MNTASSHSTLQSYVHAVEARIVSTIESSGLEPDQRALIFAGLAAKGVSAAEARAGTPAEARRKPLSSHSLAPIYALIRAHGAEVGPDAVQLGAGLMLFYFSLDLFDSVQDHELTGQYAQVGPELSINAAIALLMMAQDVLYEVVAALPAALGRRAAAVIREHSLRSCRGQHRDLASRGLEVTSADVRTTSIEKTALCAMRMELAGLALGQVDPRYREIGDGIAELRQLVNDVADLFDGDPSEDLRQGTMSLPLALFVEQTGAPGRAALADAKERRLEEGEIQRRVYASGVMRTLALQTERVRVRIHEAFAGLPCQGPYLALLLAAYDDLPSFYYRPPRLTVAVDIDQIDASSMSAPDRALLDALRQSRRARTAPTPTPASVPASTPASAQA